MTRANFRSGANDGDALVTVGGIVSIESRTVNMKRIALASLALGVGLVAALPGIASARSDDSVAGTLVNTCDPMGNAGGIWVELWDDSGRIDSVTTDAEGDYAFVDRAPGNYVVKPYIGAGCGAFPGTRAVDTTNGPVYDVDFRVTTVHDITGAVTGCPQPEGVGAPGVTVNVSDDSGLLATTETDDFGFYFFQWLEAKTDYTVEVVAPAGCGADDPTRSVDLDLGDANRVDFQLVPQYTGSFQSVFSGFAFGS